MEYKNKTYIKRPGVYYPGVLRDVKKSQQHLQPIFEAFTNALESINERRKIEDSVQGYIIFRIYQKETTDSQTEFDRLSIEDNGIGFNQKEFDRFNTYKDYTKGYNNLGSGRFQYVHYFNETKIISVFFESGNFYERKFKLSKQKSFLDNDAIIYHEYCKEILDKDISTIIEFNHLLQSSSLYNSLDDKELKRTILDRYIHHFCYNKKYLPQIRFEYYLQNKLVSENFVSRDEIPSIDKTEPIILNYSIISSDGTQIEKLPNKTETFSLDAFKIPHQKLKSNSLKLVSKGEIVNNSNLLLKNLSETDVINGDRYLFLLSSKYIDERKDIQDNRGEFEIPSKHSFVKSGRLFNSEEILLEDIQDEVSAKITSMYPNIEEKKVEHLKNLQSLKEMFLLNDETLDNIPISINDTESSILKKVYEAEAKKEADFDANVKKTLDNLSKLDTTTKKYSQELEETVTNLVRTIPFQNRNSLAHYVARRKLVLDLFGKILNKKLEIQKEAKGHQQYESLIHNLIFKKGGEDTDTSDLWLINEDFIYFQGASEKQLSQLKINGEYILENAFSEEEERYLLSLGENRKIKRPDVLLFPAEGKCIIIEFKSPDINAADHLSQIDFYANLILNYTKDKFPFTMFYGYLIGENIEPRDVLGRVGRYEQSYHFDYLYRPSEPVKGFGERKDGNIYTEVLKYSTLLSRANLRNRIFIDKLGLNIKKE